MKILLVYTEINIKFGSYGFQHGIAALSAYLKQHGYRDIEFCYVGPSYTPQPFRRALSGFRPDIIGFYTTHDQFRFVLKLLPHVSNEKTFVICGGPHATLHPDLINEHPRVNAVCIGEGENAMLELVRALESGHSVCNIPGLWVRGPRGIVKNPTASFIRDLDALPVADRDIFCRSTPWARVGLTQISYRNSFRISRGCPFHCAFCSNHEMGRAQEGSFLRFRSLENVLREIEQVVTRFRPKEIYFEDDTFTLNESFIDEFCRQYPARVGLPFEFFAHIGPSATRILGKLRAAGGRRVSFGIESGNEAFRKNVLRKSFSNQDVVDVIAAAGRMGYKTEAFVIVGFPDENLAMFADTMKLLRQTQPDLYSLSIYFPFRGTELYRRCVDKGYVDSDFVIHDRFVSRRDTVLRMPHFPRGQILKAVKQFGWQVYHGNSPRKAVLFRVYESPLGDFLLRYSAGMKRLARTFAIGT